jgi:hypothetical protein
VLIPGRPFPPGHAMPQHLKRKIIKTYFVFSYADVYAYDATLPFLMQLIYRSNYT